MARDEHMYIVSYDVSDPKRWRRLFKVMNGYGAWLQLSVFQCRLSGKRLAELRAACQEIIKEGEDHVLIMDIGPSERAEPRGEHRQAVLAHRARPDHRVT